MSKGDSKLTLYYFNGQGRAETIRLILNYAGIPFVDKRFTSEEWAKEKANFPFGVVPVLEIEKGGKKQRIHQSGAIGRYVAKLAGIAGANDEEMLAIDSLEVSIGEIGEKIVGAFFEKDEAVKKEKVGKLATDLDVPFKRLDQAAKGDYFTGAKISYADIKLFNLEGFYSMLNPDGLKAYPNLKKISSNVAKIPSIAKYVAARPKTDF